jgi:hypothetical protein
VRHDCKKIEIIRKRRPKNGTAAAIAEEIVGGGSHRRDQDSTAPHRESIEDRHPPARLNNDRFGDSAVSDVPPRPGAVSPGGGLAPAAGAFLLLAKLNFEFC